MARIYLPKGSENQTKDDQVAFLMQGTSKSVLLASYQ